MINVRPLPASDDDGGSGSKIYIHAYFQHRPLLSTIALDNELQPTNTNWWTTETANAAAL